jgi:hypothetical protein
MSARWPRYALAVVALAVVATLLVPRKTGVRETFDSPGGRYRIVVLWKANRLPWPAMPGQGGDGDGIVRLVDRQGKVLREIDVDGPVNRVDVVDWHPDSVDVKLVVQWPLDPPDTPAAHP